MAPYFWITTVYFLWPKYKLLCKKVIRDNIIANNTSQPKISLTNGRTLQSSNYVFNTTNQTAHCNQEYKIKGILEQGNLKKNSQNLIDLKIKTVTS